MSKAKNISFIENYIQLERTADELMKKNGGGISAYISALERRKSNAHAEDTLKFLKKCKAIRNKLAHDPGAIKDNSEISIKDIKRIRKLSLKMKKYKDPLSKLLRKRKKLRAQIQAATFSVGLLFLMLCLIFILLKS